MFLKNVQLFDQPLSQVAFLFSDTFLPDKRAKAAVVNTRAAHTPVQSAPHNAAVFTSGVQASKNSPEKPNLEEQN